MAGEAIRCPFCGFRGDGEWHIQLHIEEHHTEDSPFVVNETAYYSDPKAPALPPRPTTVSGSSASSRPTSDENPWVKCTRPNCGEYVAIADIQEHLDLHEAAAISEDEEKKSSGRNTPQQPDAPAYPPRENGEATTSSNGFAYRTERRSPTPSKESLSKHSRHRSSSSAEATPTRNPQKAQHPSKTPSLSGSPQKLQRPRQPTSNNSSHSSQFGRSILEYFSGTSQRGPPDRRDNRPSIPPRQYQQRRVRPPLEPGRLGRRELGPHAYEEVMPSDVRKHLLNDAVPYSRNRLTWDGRMVRECIVDNETAGLIDVLSDVSAVDSQVVAAYLCHRSVKHVEKIKCDGNFCGYWNIQMVLSYIHDRDARRAGGVVKDLPSVLAIQNVIEQAWNSGICSYGRIETGGVINTRKWIGTHEALAFFTQIGVEVEALSFKTEAAPSPAASESESSSSTPSTTHLAASQLLDHVEAYFISDLENARQHGTSFTTALPPIYFQRFGHSMTIVGLERRRDGSRNLLLFDPSFGTSSLMDRLLANKKVSATPTKVLAPYRRSEFGLSRWDEFEVIVPKTTAVQESQHKPG